jgi:RNA polymerase sigma factor (sigma-70 family)
MDLTRQFEANRARLRSMAYRMLGTDSEAEDAVQEAAVRLTRLARTEAAELENLGGWLTTVVSRICLDMLRARKARREEPAPSATDTLASADDAERDLRVADAVGVALLVVLETLTPAERVAFVLHDMFDLSFEVVAPSVGRSSGAARQHASRARRRVQGAPDSVDADRARQRELVGAFLAASRGGDFAALLAVLDPAVVLRADAAAVAASVARAAAGAPALAPEVHGADAVATTFKGRAQAVELALVDGAFGLVFAMGGQPRAVFDFSVERGHIVAIDLIADPATIARMTLDMSQ